MAQPGPPILNDRDAITSQRLANPQSVGQNSQDPANMWHQFFGPPIGEIKTNPYDKYQYETFTLPDAYRGKNIFLRDTIEGFIEENNTWYTTACLPTQITDQMHIAWNAWHFDQALASVVPEEGISRLITSSRKSQEDHTIRHGLAFTLEHGFMNTEEGRKQYLLNIQQIAQAVQETNNYDVLSSLLNCNDYEREWEKRHSIIRSPWTDIGRREVMEFAIVQKNPRGLEMLHEKYKKRMQRYGASPNMWIWPPGLALYAAFNPVVSDYDKQSASVTLNTTAEALGSFRGVNVFETREFDVRNGELPINLLERRVQVGEHYFMRDHTPNTADDAAAYDSEINRSIYIYDEAKDDFCKISFTTALDKALDTIMGRDDNPGVGRRNPGVNGLKHFDLLGDLCPKNSLFTYKASEFSDDDQHEWAEYFGQIEADHWDDDAIRRFILTAKAALAAPAGGGAARIPNTANFFAAVGGARGVNIGFGGALRANLRQDPVFGSLGPAYYRQAGGVAGDTFVLDRYLRDYTGGTAQALVAMGLPAVNTNIGASGEDVTALLAFFDSGATLTKKDLKNFRNVEAFAKFRQMVGTGGAALGLVRLQPAATQIITDALAIEADGGAPIAAGNVRDLFVVMHDGSDRGGSPQPYADVKDQLLDLLAGNGANQQMIVARINSHFAEIAAKEDPNARVGSKRANNATWAGRASKKRGVMDFASETEEVGTAYEQVHVGGGQPGGQAVIDFNTHNFRPGREVQGFRVNGKTEKLVSLLKKYPGDAVAQDLLHILWFAPIKRDFFTYLRNNKISIPFDVMIARPNMTYDMCTCILMKGGSETGATFQGHSDFQLGDDVQSKIHYGNYTYYSKALVTNPKNILLARNIYATGYVRGDDCTWIVPEEDRDGNRNGAVAQGSMYAFLVPANSHKKPNPLRLFAPEDDGYGNKFGRTMVGAELYAHIFGHNALVSNDDFETIGTRNDQNDVTYTGHSFWWKSHRENINGRSKGSYTGVTINTGHWGPNVYAGCGRVRNGEEVYLKDIQYEPEVY